MKNNLASLLACAAAVNLSSCVSRQELPVDCEIEDYDVFFPTPDDVAPSEEAEDYTDAINTLITAIEDAERLGVKVPSKFKETYNMTLTRIWMHNYFGSDHLRTALKDARLLKEQ